MYFEFINNKAKLCPSVINNTEQDFYVANPTKEILSEYGYCPKELVISPRPEYNPETERLIPIYTDGEVITLTWEAVSNGI